VYLVTSTTHCSRELAYSNLTLTFWLLPCLLLLMELLVMPR
jgi:hypothetical protein